MPATLPEQLNQELPVTPPPQSDQVEMPSDYKLMDIDIPEDIPDLLDVLQDLMSDFNTWGQDVLSYKL